MNDENLSKNKSQVSIDNYKMKRVICLFREA